MSRRFPAALPFSGVSLEKALHSVTTVHAAKTDLGLRKDVGFHAEGFMESYVRHARGRPEKWKDGSVKRAVHRIYHQLKNESNLQSVFILGIYRERMDLQAYAIALNQQIAIASMDNI